MALRRFIFVLLMPAAVLLVTGCDPVRRHQILVTFFNEVPSFPPLEEYCQEAQEKAQQKAGRERLVQAKPAADQSSFHPPYVEKRCSDCHEAEKTTVKGLVKPENELCFMCHPSIIKYRYVHGPVAEGGCLGCHLPHEANHPSLLVSDSGSLCEKCHKEPRTAPAMHDRIKAAGAVCPDCHDPHSGATRNFLK